MASVLQVADGVFFTRPAALPRGRHGLSREEVRAAHQERMMIAATELTAEQGLAAVGVREICMRAAVSRAAFYEVFTDKEACFKMAYDRFISVLLRRLALDAGVAGSWTMYVELVMKSYLDTLQADVVTARAFQVEMDALGREGRQQRRHALERVAQFLREERKRYAEPGEEIASAREYLGIVYAVRQLASDALDEDDIPNLMSLLPGLAAAGQRLWPSPRVHR